MNLNGIPTNPGQLRTPISLGKRVVAVQPGGFQVPGFAPFATAWARWQNVHGTEAWTAQSSNAEQAATVLIRYNAELDTTCGVLKGEQWFEIVSMDDVQERHEYIELKVQRARSG